MLKQEFRESGPGLLGPYDEAVFDKWMETDPVLSDPGEFFGTVIDSTNMKVYVMYQRLDRENPWPWVYLRLAWYEARGYKCEIVKAIN